jgi:hypothetical protein
MVKAGIQMFWSGDREMHLDSSFRQSDDLGDAYPGSCWPSPELFLSSLQRSAKPYSS